MSLHGKEPGWFAANPGPPGGFGHYCWGLEALNKLYLAQKSDQIKLQANNVQYETEYVIAHVAESNPLMPAVYALRGKGQMLGHKYRDAEESLTKALQLDPNYTEVYQTLIDLYLETSRKNKAIDTVKTALSFSPGNKGLRRRARELGLDDAQLPPIPPVETKPKSTIEESGSGKQGGNDLGHALSAEGETSSGPGTNDKNEAKSQMSGAGPSEKNGWCRFCPPEELAAPPPLSTPDESKHDK